MISWKGIICPVGRPSVRPPGGARGHKLIVSRNAAEKMVKLSIGTPIWDSHPCRKGDFKEIGVIEECEIVRNKLVARGRSYRKYPSNIQASRQPKLGMSFDIGEGKIADVRAEIWTLVDFETFKGCAVQTGVSFKSSFEWLEDL